MFSYNIAKNADEKAFVRACSLIDAGVENVKKDKLIEDVDGTKIQIYKTSAGKIKVFNDYEVDAVYIDSDVDLSNVIKN